MWYYSYTTLTLTVITDILEKKLQGNIPYSHNGWCVTYAMTEEEADESSCKAVALCTDVEVVECEGRIAVMKDVVLEIVMVNIATWTFSLPII